MGDPSSSFLMNRPIIERKMSTLLFLLTSGHAPPAGILSACARSVVASHLTKCGSAARRGRLHVRALRGAGHLTGGDSGGHDFLRVPLVFLGLLDLGRRSSRGPTSDTDPPFLPFSDPATARENVPASMVSYVGHALFKRKPSRRP